MEHSVWNITTASIQTFLKILTQFQFCGDHNQRWPQMFPILHETEEARTWLKISASGRCKCDTLISLFSFNIHRKQFIHGNNNDQTYLGLTMTKLFLFVKSFFLIIIYTHCAFTFRNVTMINKTLSCKLWNIQCVAPETNQISVHYNKKYANVGNPFDADV